MEAAAVAIEVDPLGEAIGLLEQGQGILLARQLETPGFTLGRRSWPLRWQSSSPVFRRTLHHLDPAPDPG